MRERGIRVLLWGRGFSAASLLLQGLEHSGCICSLASTHDEALTLLQKNNFQLVLSGVPVREAIGILSLLAASNCSFFCAYPVEEGVWWVPLMKQGKECVGEPAFRAEEFWDALDLLLEEARSRDNELSPSAEELSGGMERDTSTVFRSVE